MTKTDYTLFGQFITVLSGCTQTNATQVISFQTRKASAFSILENWQIQIETSTTPSAGTMDIYGKTPYATQFVKIGTVQMTASPQIYSFKSVCNEIQLIPTSFDSDKTYNAVIVNY